MRRAMKWVLPAVCAAWLAAARAGAEEDPARDARLAAIDGHFREADGIIERAPAEVQNDPALRLAVGEAALKFAANASGEEKRQALFSARGHFAKVVELKPSDDKAAAGVVESSRVLADLYKEAKQPDDERRETKFALEFGAKAIAAGVAAPAFKLALGRMYARHASFLKSMKDVNELDADSKQAAALLKDAAVGSEQAGKILSEASTVRLRVAGLIHEGIPVDAEKRDDEALSAAIDLATQACIHPGATDGDYMTHLEALILSHAWGATSATKPFMQPLVPPLPGMTIEISRTGCWKRVKSAPDWELDLERDLKDNNNFGVIQVSFVRLESSKPILGKSWSQLGEVAKRLYEADTATLETVAYKVEPIELTGRAGADFYHYEVGGQVKGGRAKRIGQWVGFADKKKDKAIQLRMYDWRRLPDLQEPDIVAFVGSAIGDGVWPPGAAAPEKPDPKKPPTPPTPPKKK